MWQRFTHDARQVLLDAQELAVKSNCAEVDTLHLLLALVGVPLGPAAKVLIECDVSPDEVRGHITVETGADPLAGEARLTPKVKGVLESAADEARRMRANHIGPEHLLLGLLARREGAAAGILDNMGLTLEAARGKVLVVSPKPAAPAPEPWPRYSPRVHQVVQAAKHLAEKIGNRRVNPEDLLLSLLGESQGTTAEILREFKIDREELYGQMRVQARLEARSGFSGAILTTLARRLLTNAADEARRIQITDVDLGAQHFLLAMLRHQSGIATLYLRDKGITLEAVTAAALPGEVSGETDVAPTDPYTQSMAIALLALEEARRMGQQNVGTGHILIALLAEPDGAAAKILGDMGVTLDDIRAWMDRYCG